MSTAGLGVGEGDGVGVGDGDGVGVGEGDGVGDGVVVGVGSVFDVGGGVFDDRISNAIKAIEAMTMIDMRRTLF